MGLVRVDSAGETEPNDLAAFIAHLFFMEPANFAFVSLLLADDGRLFQRLCRPGPRRDETVLSVLCHVFMRSPLPASLAARARQRGSTSGPSVVLLPDLSAIGDKVKCPGGEEVSEGELVRRALCSKQALRSLEAYCACFASAHAAELGDDDTLPVSGRRLAPQPGCGGAAAADLGPLLGPLAIRPRVRSAFAGLSGHGDRFGSVDELCSTLRAGLYLDPQTVPVFELRPTAAPLNAYILDFFKHGQIRALVRYNRIRRDVVFEDLRSFALLLKALHAATARRAGTASAFAHPHVLDALESISRRFNEQLREASA
jgi:ATP-dependent RNA helicase DDX60